MHVRAAVHRACGEQGWVVELGLIRHTARYCDGSGFLGHGLHRKHADNGVDLWHNELDEHNNSRMPS